MIHTVTLNPSLDKTAKIDRLEKGSLNRIEITSFDIGGKGLNATKTIRALNGTSRAYVILGGSTGTAIKEILDKRKIPLFVSEVKQNTRVNLKLIDKSGRLTEINELGPQVSKKNIKELLDELKANVKPHDVVIFGGSIPPGVDTTVYKKMILEVKKRGAIAILDTQGEALVEGIKSCPTIIKPNRSELAEYFNEPLLSIPQCIEKAKELVKTGIVLVVVSLGDKGALFVTKNEVYHALPIRVETKSPVGAGDAMIGAIAYGYDQKYTLEEIIKCAMATATGAVTTEGTSPADAKSVKRLMKGVVIKKK